MSTYGPSQATPKSGGEIAALPPLYAAWVDSLLEGPIPSETDATCDDCAMCAGADVGARTNAGTADRAPGVGNFYDPASKCCTFLPQLANYLVGRILLDRDAESDWGRQTVVARLERGVAVTPLGLGRTAAFEMLYRNGRHLFGKSQALRCPHYIQEGGRCGVWRHRESTCATWFCKHVRGVVGKEFWNQLHALLTAVEQCLARWCVLELEIGAAALAILFPLEPGDVSPLDAAAVDGRSDAAHQRAVWGTWAGREAEFYEAASRLVATLSWSDVLAVGGPDVRLRARLTRDAHARLVSAEVPGRLRQGTFTTVGSDARTVTVSAYSPLDPIRLPRDVTRVLHHFDGRPTADVLEAIERAEGLSLDPSLVRKLADFGILVDGRS